VEWGELGTPSVRGGSNRSDMGALEDMLAGIALRLQEARAAEDAQNTSSPSPSSPSSPSPPSSSSVSWVERAPAGTVVEYSNRASLIAHELAERVSAQRGAALVVDYGRDGASSFSLRGIRGHAFVDVLSEPGRVDLSVDVDFRALGLAAALSPRVAVDGPVSQSRFLHSLGILERAMQVVEALPDDDVRRVEAALRRLLHPDEMGHIYKVLAFAHHDVRVPYGFQDEEEEEEGGEEEDGGEGEGRRA
jgi:SAM-dependent MidA family methyltransferase